MAGMKLSKTAQKQVAEGPQWVRDFLDHPDSVENTYEKRDLLERWGLADIVTYAYHLDRERNAELPDKTFDQFMVKAAHGRWDVKPRFTDGWLIVDAPDGQHWFILDSDGKTFSSYQVL